MAQQEIQLDQEKLSCSICLDLLKDPVTIPCGHSYCMSCIQNFWDEEDEKKIHSCPQCRQTFTPRPVLEKNVVLAGLVEDLKKTKLQAELQAAPAEACDAGPGDVACDFCTGRKMKAFKSCVTCLASYCEEHLQPHYGVPPLKKHKLIEASANLQGNMCCHHNEVMKMFCCTDQQCICYLCPVDEHKGHDTVSAAAEKAERKSELGVTRDRIQQKIQKRGNDVKVLQEEVEAINRSADEALRDSEEIFTQMIQLLETKISDVKEQIRSQQESEVSRAEELREKLEQEIAELKMKDAELQQLSNVEDDIQFLQRFPSLSCLSESYSPSANTRPRKYFKDVMPALSKIRDKLKNIFIDEFIKMPLIVTNVDVLLPPAEPKSRDQFLRLSQRVEFDSNTAHKNTRPQHLKRIGERKNWCGTVENKEYTNCGDHPDRFTDWRQVLSKEYFARRCYWEVDMKLMGGVHVAVAYKNIQRKDIPRTYRISKFGMDASSWALCCYPKSNYYAFTHDGRTEYIKGPESSKIGVYVDRSAGILSFYSVHENTMTLLHRVHTSFTEPLYAGVGFDDEEESSASLCVHW